MQRKTVQTYSPADPVTDIPLIGPSYAHALEQLNIHTVKDLLYHFPFRYEDTRTILSIEELRTEGQGTIQGTVLSVSNTRTRNGRFLTKALIEDGSGSIPAVWFSQPYLSKVLKRGEIFLFSGKTGEKWGPVTLMNPQYERISQDVFSWNSDSAPIHLGKLSPVYPETRGITSKWLRARLKTLKPYITELIEDFLPVSVLEQENLMDLPSAITALHFPKDEDDVRRARERLGADELVRIRLQTKETLAARARWNAYEIKDPEQSTLIKQQLTALPFSLTRAQTKALEEIAEDIQKATPMYRLLNGEVGSGKTVVSLLAALACIDSGYTTVIMAPTTILAHQHYESVTTLLKRADIHVPVQLLTGETSLSNITLPQIIIGTHALLFTTALPNNTALIVIDEQHRFGVVQRKKLMQLTAGKSAEAQESTVSEEEPQPQGILPHYLTMTATPIPRTLTMALYGSTSVSVLDELPHGRIPVKTHVVSESKRRDAYTWIGDKLEEGQQAFIICPLVEGSDKVQAKAVTEEFEHLKTDIFPTTSLALLHGQMKEDEKTAILNDFKNCTYDILVATPVIEVGIDIPNATMMIIEDAERFGLAQLHQLRGRVGRGDQQAYCFLFTSSRNPDAQDRLQYFASHQSGFDVAEYDLKRRGPGEVYGIRQSGLLDIQFADLSDPDAFKQAQRIADMLDNAVS
ncbi:MAG: ATP-dependent DNA helicase RecG [Candidatus Dojkabacteria bacterium]|nr:ATP-dependent DNA helicase RecG [Candidatus Dojkabacteria bacterium]